MQKDIHFLSDDYNYLKKVIKTGKYDEEKSDSCGYINVGAVSCELIITEDMLDEDDECSYGKHNVQLEGNIYLLGDDTGYGILDDSYSKFSGTPYSLVEGFFARVENTYEKTRDGILNTLEKIINGNKKLLIGAKETELTWQNAGY